MWRLETAMNLETPPRAWGRQAQNGYYRERDGNTPTCVGKTVLPFLNIECPKKHPHVRGEDQGYVEPVNGGIETPPRAWGRQAVRDRLAPLGRNTPTCVGKTRLSQGLSSGMEKHPHVRGEDLNTTRNVSRWKETPPRAWGRQEFIKEDEMSNRNTPTCVGKTGTWHQKTRKGRKHPHVRGEDRGAGNYNLTILETPPRAWGRLHHPLTPSSTTRNTPTCVGKTTRFLLSRKQERKHPHVRGEDPKPSSCLR